MRARRVRLGGHGHRGDAWPALRAGGICDAHGGSALPARLRRRHRAGRRGRENPVSGRGRGSADERLLRGRYGRVHRPDGHAAEHHARRDELSRPVEQADLHHRLALRRVCQKRHPAAHQSGRVEKRHLREHFRRGRQPDGRGAGAGTAAGGENRLSRRSADLFESASRQL